MMEKYLVFSEQEYKKRNDKAKKLMEKEGLDGCIFCKAANLMYFSGYVTTLFSSDFRPFFYILPREGEPCLVVPALEKGGAEKTSFINNVRIWGGKNTGAPNDPVTLLIDLIKESRLDGKRLGFELSMGQRLGMTIEQFNQLQNGLPQMQVGDNAGVVWPCRMIKSPAEIDLIRKSCKANDDGFNAAVDAIRHGVTEKEVETAMAMAMVKSGGIPKFMTITAGVNRYDMMNPDASPIVTLKDGDMVVMDFGCTYDRYYSDVTRGVFVGKPNPRAEEIYKVVRDVSEHALEQAKPGNPVSAIDAAAEKRIVELGYKKLMLHRTGHALGLEVHEIPSIAPGDDTILEEGMVFAIEPGLYDYSVGGFRIEDDIVITKTGYEFLSNGSRDIIVK